MIMKSDHQYRTVSTKRRNLLITVTEKKRALIVIDTEKTKKSNVQEVKATVEVIKNHLQQKRKLEAKIEKQETIADLRRLDIFLFCHNLYNDIY